LALKKQAASSDMVQQYAAQNVEPAKATQGQRIINMTIKVQQLEVAHHCEPA